MRTRAASAVAKGGLLAACVSTAVSAAAVCAAAEDGACGLEAGMWATPEDACRYARAPDEAERRFGGDALLEWHLGAYRFQGATCGIFSSKRAGPRCTLRVECSSGGGRYMGEWDIEVETERKLRFGTRADSPTYYYCAAAAGPR